LYRCLLPTRVGWRCHLWLLLSSARRCRPPWRGEGAPLALSRCHTITAPQQSRAHFLLLLLPLPEMCTLLAHANALWYPPLPLTAHALIATSHPVQVNLRHAHAHRPRRHGLRVAGRHELQRPNFECPWVRPATHPALLLLPPATCDLRPAPLLPCVHCSDDGPRRPDGRPLVV